MMDALLTVDRSHPTIRTRPRQVLPDAGNDPGVISKPVGQAFEPRPREDLLGTKSGDVSARRSVSRVPTTGTHERGRDPSSVRKRVYCVHLDRPRTCAETCATGRRPGRPGQAGRLTRGPSFDRGLASSQYAAGCFPGGDRPEHRHDRKEREEGDETAPTHRGVLDDQETVNGDGPKEKRDRQQSEGDRDNVPAREALHLGIKTLG